MKGGGSSECEVVDRRCFRPDGRAARWQFRPDFDLASVGPFLALRSYLPDDHPDKAKEIGSEATPAEFLDTLLALTAEWRRLLAPHGSLVVELGDTYAGSGGGGGDYYEDGLRAGQPGFTGSASASREALREANARHWREKNAQRSAWPLDKSLSMLPTLYPACLAYGRNLLTGQPSPAGMWRIRNLKPWIRSSPPVGALADKERPATSYITVATLARDRYFDLDSVRRGTTAPPGAARVAVLGIPDAHVVPTTLHAGGRAALRGWCQPGNSKVTVGPAVTWQAKRLQVVEPVGFLVGIEELVGTKVMDLQAPIAAADAASVAITVEGCLAGTMPVPPSVGGPATVPSGIVLASDVDAPPFTGTLKSAEVVRQDLALVAGNRLAARIALKLDGADATAYAVAPFTSGEFASGHSEQSNSNYGTAGAPPLDWVHTVDLILDNEIDARAGKRNGGGNPTSGGHRTPRTRDSDGDRDDRGADTVGARGHHLRRALERAGILTTLDTLDVSPKGYAGAHYAAWAPELCRILIDEMCPRRVCTVCGEPSRRIVEGQLPASGGDRERDRQGRGRKARARDEIDQPRTTVGWSDCGCIEHPNGGPCDCGLGGCKFDYQTTDRWRPGHVLDPFTGSGTTLAVATGMGRNATGIDLDPRNADLARERCGMFLEIDQRPTDEVAS